MVLSKGEFEKLVEEIIALEFEGNSESYKKLMRKRIRTRLEKQGVHEVSMSIDDTIAALENGDSGIAVETAIYYLNRKTA